MTAPQAFRYISSDRRVREDRRFVVGKGRYPDSNGRWVIYCQPAQLAVVNAACDVITGKARAVRIKPAKLAAPATISHDYLTR